MKGAATEPAVAVERKLDYRQTTDIVQGFFAWKPNRVKAQIIKALFVFMRPLEHGTYSGPVLSGDPQRAAWVIASPLTVFVLPEAGLRQKMYLAARLRNTGPINIIHDAPAETKPKPASSKKSKRGKRAGKEANPRLQKLAEKLSKAGISSSQDIDGGGGPNFDLEALIAIQNESDVGLTVVPVARAHHQLVSEAPPATVAARVYKFHPLQLFRKTTNWFRTFRTARVKNCKPFVLSTWISENQAGDLCSQAAALRVRLMSNIESERRACTGPPLSPKWEVKRRVLADPVLSAYMQDYALREGMTREAVIGEAREYFDEIASDYRVGVVRYFCRAVDYAFSRFLDGLDVDREGVRFLSECDTRSRIVLICSHKSYVDPLLIGYTLFRCGMVPPQQAAGLNLNFWPVGWLLRHSGAFYLRRTFAGETVYREVFGAYVRYLLAENYTSVVYIEGTRSRDGKLQRPKTGYLSILEESLNMGVCPDITLVPVYLGYDKVPEESAHVKEMAGGRKVSESMKGFARIYKSINTRLGRAYVKFGTPMSFKSLLANHGLEGTAEIACDGVNAITPVTARSLAACALLAPGTTVISSGEFESAVEELLRFSERRRLPLSVDSDREGILAAVEWFEREGHVSRDTVADEEVYRVEGSGRRFLEYNKNIPLGHFMEASMSAVVAGTTGNGEADDLEFLRTVFSQEFIFSPTREAEAWKLDHQMYADTLRSLLDSYLEAYLIASRALTSIPAEEPVKVDDAVEFCFSEGERMLKEGSIRREESLCRVAFKNAIKGYREMGLVTQTLVPNDHGKMITVVSRGENFDEFNSLEQRLTSLLPQ